jgi:hypothetical protein
LQCAARRIGHFQHRASGKGRNMTSMDLAMEIFEAIEGDSGATTP